MAVNREPVVKRCRTLGIDPLYMGYEKKSKRDPKKSRKKPSEYGIQLKEKQKVKFYYGLLEKQFKKYYTEAERRKGITGEVMLSLLERRLDNVIYRMGIGSTRAMSRQIVGHGHVCVNEKRVNIPSYQVNVNDVISIKENKQKIEMFKELKDTKVILPKWLEFDSTKLTGKVLDLPKRDDVDLAIEEHYIVEHYSR